VQIVIYPAGTEIPSNKTPESVVPPATTAIQSIQAPSATTAQPQ